MKTESIEIEGEALDLKESGERLAFSLTSNLLHGLSDYSSCYTYSYEVPNSPRNRRLLGELLLPGASDRRVRQNLPCVYSRDGVALLEGSLSVVSADPDVIVLSMIFGAAALKELIEGDLSIYELDWEGSPTLTVAENGAAVGLSLWRYGQPRPAEFWAFANEYYVGLIGDKAPKVPAAVAVSSITNRIKSKTGVELEGLETEGDIFQFTPEYRKGGRWEATASRVGPAAIFGSDVEVVVGYSYTGVTLLDIRERYTGSNGDYATPMLRADSRVSGLSFDIYNGGNNAVRLYAAPYVSSLKNSYLGLLNAEGQPRPEHLLCSVGVHQREIGVKTLLDVGLSNDYQPFVIFVFGGGALGSILEVDIKLNATFDYGSVTSGSVLIGDCLPDISLADFLSQYAQLRFGRFPVNSLRGGSAIRFVSLEEVAAAEPYDWSDKLLAEGLRHSYRLDELARANWLNFADDDSEALFEEGIYNQNYETLDETLDAETDFSEVSFSYSYRPAGSARMLTMVYGEEKHPAPRLVEVGTGTAQRSPYGDDTNLYTAYDSPALYWLQEDNAMRRTMREPNVVECAVRLTTSDLLDLDLARPVYLRQFGKLFFIDSADIDGDNIAELKLVELK